MKKKTFIKPEADIISFSFDDIITFSGPFDEAVQGFDGEDYDDE